MLVAHSFSILATLVISKTFPVDAIDAVISGDSSSNSTKIEKAIFGLGCFWKSDARFGILDGVIRTRVGYAGGSTANPVYHNLGDNSEVVEVIYDADQIKYEDLVDHFWKMHDPTKPTLGSQYQSLILYSNDGQSEVANKKIRDHQTSLKKPILTQVKPLTNFYQAEDDNQKFFLRMDSLLRFYLGYDDKLLVTSSIAAKINGYMAGLGTIDGLNKHLLEWKLNDSAARTLQWNVEQKTTQINRIDAADNMMMMDDEMMMSHGRDSVGAKDNSV